MLSQYPEEEEVANVRSTAFCNQWFDIQILFPPLTMLTVEFDEEADKLKQIVEKTTKGVLVRIVVVPLWT